MDIVVDLTIQKIANKKNYILFWKPLKNQF